MRLWGDEVDFAAVDAGMSVARFAERLHLIPEFADGSGDVFGGGVADPREDFDEAGFVESVADPDDEMGFGEYKMLLAVEDPHVGKDVLELVFFARLDVIGDQHGFGGRLGVGGGALAGMSGGAGGDEGKKREGDDDGSWFHRVMLGRLPEVGNGRKPGGVVGVWNRAGEGGRMNWRV